MQVATRPSLRPLLSKRDKNDAKLGRECAARRRTFGLALCSSVVCEEPGSSDVLSRDGLDEGSDDDTQELCEPSQEQAEVIAGRGENSVDAVAETSLEVVPVHAVPGLDWPMTGSTAARRFISRRMEAVTRRTCPEIQTLNRCGWL